jgi:hypothetical protein
MDDGHDSSIEKGQSNHIVGATELPIDPNTA